MHELVSLLYLNEMRWMGKNNYLYAQVLPDLLSTVHACEDGLKEFITWKLGTLVSIVRQV